MLVSMNNKTFQSTSSSVTLYCGLTYGYELYTLVLSIIYMAWFKLNHICEATLYLSICASSTFAMAMTKKARQEKYQTLSLIKAKIIQQRMVIKIRILVQQSKPEIHIYLLAFTEKVIWNFQVYFLLLSDSERMWFQAVLDISMWAMSIIFFRYCY